MTDSDDKRRFPPRQVSSDVTRANRKLVGARVVASWVTDVDGWLGLELEHSSDPGDACQVVVNPTDIRFRYPQS